MLTKVPRPNNIMPIYANHYVIGFITEYKIVKSFGMKQFGSRRDEDRGTIS